MAAQSDSAPSSGRAASTPTAGSAPWPNTLAAKILASYLHLKYDLSAADVRFFNPKMGAMPFFNNSATPDVRHDELALVAGAMLKFLFEIGVGFEPGHGAASAHSELLAAMEPETNLSSEMVAAIDANYRFMDESNA